MESERLRLSPPSLQYVDAMYDAIDESRYELSQFLPWVSGNFTKARLEETEWQGRRPKAHKARRLVWLDEHPL